MHAKEWIKETRLDIRPSSRVEDAGEKENRCGKDSQEVEKNPRRHAAKSIQHGIVARLARVGSLARYISGAAPALRFVLAPPSHARGFIFLTWRHMPLLAGTCHVLAGYGVSFRFNSFSKRIRTTHNRDMTALAHSCAAASEYPKFRAVCR